MGVVRAAAVGLGLALCLAISATAAAHSLRSGSEPAAGATLAAPPARVSITFTERPDPGLSSIHVLDATGTDQTTGPVGADPADPKTLTVALRPVGGGVFTVTWRTVSSVDGHAAAGSFAFGVGATPAPADAGSAALEMVPASPVQTAGRVALYVGLILLVGVSFVALMVAVPAMTSRQIVVAGAILTTAGTAGVVAGAVATAGVGLADLAGSSLGPVAGLRIVTAAAVVLVATIMAAGRGGRPAFGALALAAAAAMLVDVVAGHAAGGATPAVSVAIQWLHVLAIGIWLGGLASLLLAVRGAPSDQTGRFARRFSRWAGFGLAVVAVTGILRAIAEIGTFDALLGSDFGRVVVLKGGLLIGLAGLGAINRFRNVPAAGRALRGLRRVGTGELILGLVVLLASGVLVDLTPPADAAPPQRVAAPTSLTSAGADFGTSVRATLTIAPGAVGFNRFSFHATDFDTRQPLPADRITLRMTLPARSDIAPSPLVLDRQPDGSFEATGANLSLAGTWRITALIVRTGASVEVPLQMTVMAAPRRIDVSAAAGAPTIYTVHLDAGRTVQVYADPGAPGPNDFHTTFFDAVGAGLAAQGPVLSMVGPSGGPVKLEPRVLEPGHFVASLQATRGTYSFSIHATAPDGSPLETVVDMPIGL
jgi:copper transport protein